MGGERSLGTDPTISGDSFRSPLAADESELAPGTMVGEYRIEGLLGSGGMGRVYAAIHPVIGKRAAVKVLHPALSVERDAVDRFVQEARSVNQIGHPNIVDIFSFGALSDGRCYFVMEQLRGESLGARIERAQLPIADALSILDTIAVALEAAHRKGIVHRDLKPDNVFLVEVEGSQPQVKLLDFGIAKLLGGEAPLQRTRTGNVMGTPAYISPEQARGQGVDHRTDIYAFGAVAFELLTNRWPFPATNAADMIAKHLFEAPPSAAELNPSVDPELDHLIKRMLAKDVDERPTLEQAREQLRACRNRIYQRQALHEGGHTDPVVSITDPRLRTNDPLALSAPISPPVSATVFEKHEARQRRVLFIGLGLVIVACIVGAVVYFGRTDDHRSAPAAAQPTKPAAPTTAEPTTAPSPSTTPASPPAAPASAEPTPAAVEPVGDPSAPATATKPATEPSTPPAERPSKPTSTNPTRPAKPKPKPTPTKPAPIDDPDAPM